MKRVLTDFIEFHVYEKILWCARPTLQEKFGKYEK